MVKKVRKQPFFMERKRGLRSFLNLHIFQAKNILCFQVVTGRVLMEVRKCHGSGKGPVDLRTFLRCKSLWKQVVS